MGNSISGREEGPGKPGAVKDTLHQASGGCLKTALENVFAIVIACSVGYFIFGPEGLLFGFLMYPIMRFAEAFHDVFAPRQKE